MLYPLNKNIAFGVVAILTNCLKDHSTCFCYKMNRSQDHSYVFFLSFSRKNAAVDKDHSRPLLFAIVSMCANILVLSMLLEVGIILRVFPPER